MQMEGLAGKAGWRWIFIIEGVVRVLLRPLCPSLKAEND